MAKFAFLVPPLMGHVNPTLAVGTELLCHGHTVTWISPDENLAGLLPDGGQLHLIRYENADAQRQEDRQLLDSIYRKNVYGAESIKFLYEEVLIPLNRYLFPGMISYLRQLEPDVVINDHQVFAGALAAVMMNIPYATSITAPAAINTIDELPAVHEWETRKIVSLQKELGWEGEKNIACSDTLALLFTSKQFFGERQLADHFHFVGPAIRSTPAGCTFNWDKFHSLPSQWRVLISIGTTFDHQYKKAFFEKVIEALGNEPLSVLVVSDPALFEEWPSNFMVRSRIPQPELLPHLDAVVCHGGHNTVCETLFHGLPLVVIPIAYDQSHVASRVTSAECGIRLNFKRFKAGDLQQAVWGILREPRYREAALRIGDSFKRAGGAGKAASLLEKMVPITISHH